MAQLKVTAIFWLILLGANAADAFQCYAGNSNETLENTVHLSDVVLAGRIVSVSEGEFGTHSAVVSYYYSYKHDGLMHKKFFWHITVHNIIFYPQVGQLGIFFLFRDPSMKMSLFCMTPVNMVENYQEVIDSINEIGSSDTDSLQQFAPLYPSPCETEPRPCGAGAFCSERNTLPGMKTRCSCLIGFTKNQSGSCQAMTSAVEEAHCSQCTHAARCSADATPLTKCTCAHIDCRGTLQESVCGSDDRNYPSVCEMRRESCRQQRNIHKLYDGKCRNNVPQACMGMGHPVATSTGLLQCDNCPTQHFCHSVPAIYAVCCPVLHPLNTSPPSVVQATPTATKHSPSPPCKSHGASGDFDSDVVGSGEGSGAYDDTEGC